jgi:O-antigen ligase
VAGLVLPHLAIGQSAGNQGAWSGVYGHKSILGRIAAIAMVVVIYVRPRFAWQNTLRWITGAIFLFLSVMSQSRVSWLMMLAALALVPILAILRSRRLSGGLKSAIAGTLAILTAASVTVGYSSLLASFGRDATFSGRTLLWQGAIDVAADNHPTFGAGYRAFWTESAADDVRAYIPHWGSLPDHGHNGYLDIWLELGAVGAVLFALFIILTLFRLLRRIVAEPNEPAWPALFSVVCIFLVNNSAASVAFRHSDIAWAFVVLAALYSHSCVTARAPVISGYQERRRRAVDPAYDRPRRTPAWAEA